MTLHVRAGHFCWLSSFSLYLTDLLHVASITTDNSSMKESSRVSLKCFCKSFTHISSEETLLCDLPICSKPCDGFGILVNLTGKDRWQPFATWIVKLINKCLTEGTLFVEGLINPSFVLGACTLLCYGDADMHMVGNYRLYLRFSTQIYPLNSLVQIIHLVKIWN